MIQINKSNLKPCEIRLMIRTSFSLLLNTESSKDNCLCFLNPFIVVIVHNCTFPFAILINSFFVTVPALDQMYYAPIKPRECVPP